LKIELSEYWSVVTYFDESIAIIIDERKYLLLCSPFMCRAPIYYSIAPSRSSFTVILIAILFQFESWRKQFDLTLLKPEPISIKSLVTLH